MLLAIKIILRSFRKVCAYTFPAPLNGFYIGQKRYKVTPIKIIEKHV